jgi:hypothetical protein
MRYALSQGLKLNGAHLLLVDADNIKKQKLYYLLVNKIDFEIDAVYEVYVYVLSSKCSTKT